MVRNWWQQTVYPPRYYVGFLVVRRGRAAEQIDLIDAPLLPLDAHTAALFCGTRDSCYYSARFTPRPLVLLEIQYAISVLDPARGRVRVEKFNHRFEREGDTVVETTGGLTRLRTKSGRPLYRSYRLDEVLDHLDGHRRPVLQFIA